MAGISPCLIAFIAAIGLSALVFPDSSPAAPSYVQGEVLVRFRPGTPDESIQKLHAKLGTGKKIVLPLVEVQRVKIAPGLSVEEAVALYQQDPNVLYAEPNYIRRAFVTPDDPDFDQQWGLHNTGQTVDANLSFSGTPDADIDVPEAWKIFTDRGIVPGVTTEGTPLIVAVIDSGMDYNHPDLAANVWTNPDDPLDGIDNDDFDNDNTTYVDDIRGWDFIGSQSCTLDAQGNCLCPQDDPDGQDEIGDNNPMDDYGHGTHVAGILAAEGNNGVGVAGVMWQAQIMPLKIIDGVGCGSVVDEVQAIGYAIAKGASIINASFGGEGSSEAEQDAIAEASAAGIVFVAAAGNGGQDGVGDNNNATPIFPASYRLDNLISVAASTASDRLASFSNFGQGSVDVAAPGDCVLSTTPPTGTFTLESGESCSNTPITPDYAYLSGTSMATPHVSGVAGLLLTQDDSLTPAEIKAILSLTTDPLSSLSGLVASSGRLNARKALLREAGSGLTGGEGGCGGLGFVEGGAVPPGTAMGFMAVLFLPLLLPLIRRWHLRRTPDGVYQRPLRRRMLFVLIPLGVVAFGTGPVQAQESTTAEPFQLPHSVALKLGYHFYPPSDYFDTNAADLDPGDFAGVSGEFEYDYQWEEKGSLSFTLGYYDGQADAGEICCTRLKFSTTYFLITPQYHILAPPLDGYLGAGIGYYLFERKQSGSIDISDSLSTSLAGFHVLIGVQWLLTPSVSTFVEVRYAWASVSSANALDDSLGIGGANFALGAAYHFSGFR